MKIGAAHNNAVVIKKKGLPAESVRMLLSRPTVSFTSPVSVVIWMILITMVINTANTTNRANPGIFFVINDDASIGFFI